MPALPELSFRDASQPHAVHSPERGDAQTHSLLSPLARPSTPECGDLYLRSSNAARGEVDTSYEAICANIDDAKARWHQELLRTPADGQLARAQRIAKRVETLHGKPRQTDNAQALFDLWSPRLPLASSSPHELVTLRSAMSLLNLSELSGAPARLYCSSGKPTEEQTKNFSERPDRLVSLLQQTQMATPELVAVLRDFYINEAKPRSLGTQLLDVCERAAAMLSARPTRPPLADEKVADILEKQASNGLFSRELMQVVRESLQRKERSFSNETL